jgi:hypothetical protein
MKSSERSAYHGSLCTDGDGEKEVREALTAKNHDGLVQKARFPLKKLNEIHGSWFDKKDPVVLMDDDTQNPKNYKSPRRIVGKSGCVFGFVDFLVWDAFGWNCIVDLQQTPYDK